MNENTQMLKTILAGYGLTAKNIEIKQFGNGLINHTFTVIAGADKFILQRINDHIFKQPGDIAANIRMIDEWLAKNNPAYLFVAAEKTLKDDDLVFSPGNGYYRLFRFINNSHTIDVVSHPSQAYEAAKQFGRFTKTLAAFPASSLHTTLPNFHNLPLRYQQFETAFQQGNKERIREASACIEFLRNHQSIVSISETISTNAAFKKRVTHHDTKISNVLFDEQDNGLCVIDLDTVMPGYFISDVGDMMRTYLSPVSEEENDFSKILIREEYFKAIADGYLSEMQDELTLTEKAHFVYAGKFMICMQALRFLSDYLNNDIYYGSKYAGQNFIRAKNQVVLLQKLIEKETYLSSLIC